MRIVLTVVLLLCAGCTLPQWRVFQSKVPTVEVSSIKVEAERRAVALIDEISTPPVQDSAKAIADVHAVSAPLRASIGEPETPVKREDSSKVIAELRGAIKDRDEKIEAWKRWAKKHQGVPLEDTGINLAGPAGILGLVGIIAACIACPSLGYLLLRVVPILWGFFRRTTTAIAEFAESNPDAGEKLKTQLSRRMDEAHKKLVRKKVKP